MKFGVFDHMDRAGPDLGRQFEERLRLVELYEGAGFHAYHLAEHHATPLGMAPSPSVFLAAVAQRTTTLRFGPLVYTLNLYHPLRLIDEICMLDQMSGGRLELGVGYGWNREECATHGVDLDTVRPRLIDHIALMRELWTGDEGTYSGDYCSVEPSWSWPKPAQQPAPPIHVGARATTDVFDDIATWADGWLPNRSRPPHCFRVP